MGAGLMGMWGGGVPFRGPGARGELAAEEEPEAPGTDDDSDDEGCTWDANDDTDDGEEEDDEVADSDEGRE
jgi:hypothetical protein